MKKFFIAFIFATILVTGTVFADCPNGFGVGIQSSGGSSWSDNWTSGNYGGITLTLKFPNLPIFWAIEAMNFNTFGLLGDYYIFHNKLVSDINLNWYLGFGVSAYIWNLNDNLCLGASSRLPIGLSWQPIDLLELYIQVAPSLGVQIMDNFNFPFGGWRGDIGIRFWF